MIYWRFSTEIIGKFLSGAWYRLNPLWLWSKTTFQDYFKNTEIWTEWVKYRNMWFWYWFLLYRDLFHGRQLIGDRVTWRCFLSVIKRTDLFYITFGTKINKTSWLIWSHNGNCPKNIKFGLQSLDHILWKK
jgi:hypothetical protein